MSFQPAAEKMDMRLTGDTYFTVYTTSKGLRSAKAAPGQSKHMTRYHCAIRLLCFAAPVKRNPSDYIADCEALRYQNSGTSAGWTVNEPTAAILGALGTDQASAGRSALVPGVSGLVSTVESIIDAIARNPELEAAAQDAELSLKIMQVPAPFGTTAVLQMAHDGTDIQWTYARPRDYQTLDKKVFRTGMVIKSTHIPASVFVGYAGLWRDSMQYLVQTAA